MVDPAHVHGSWSHSHEEDHDGLMVFRPSDRELPPSRGRTTFALLPDGRVAKGLPGPDDRGALTDGTWELSGDVLRVSTPDGEDTYDVVAAAPDLLELRPG